MLLYFGHAALEVDHGLKALHLFHPLAKQLRKLWEFICELRKGFLDHLLALLQQGEA